MIIKKWRLKSAIIFFLVIFFIFINLNNNFNRNHKNIKMNNKVSVENFKALPNDNNEDTLFIQKAIDHVAKDGGGTILFPKGTYLIDAIRSIVLRDNIILKFDKGTILKALPNDKGSYEIVRIHGVKNASLTGNVVIEGEREEHIGEKGEWGFGVSIRGSENILLENITIKNCWGDGIYIGSTENKSYSKNITINNPVLKNNQRQGISVISVIKLKIVNPFISDTKGKAPESGIDLEPNNPMERLESVEIINPFTENNNGTGLLINLKYLHGSKYSVSIKVYDVKNVKDGIQIVKPRNIKGTVEIIKVY
ncbi:right-handed parallel beta-helix repeat-containing protein [Peribacillus sp. NPDC096448]|uniref:right-handed parallel beta-helix repeat-containing protein n=1 Tax=Peribacillus sp. NPDC096448 TaxID=3364395 RepID=UPI0038037706